MFGRFHKNQGYGNGHGYGDPNFQSHNHRNGSGYNPASNLDTGFSGSYPARSASHRAGVERQFTGPASHLDQGMCRATKQPTNAQRRFASLPSHNAVPLVCVMHGPWDQGPASFPCTCPRIMPLSLTTLMQDTITSRDHIHPPAPCDLASAAFREESEASTTT
jgi:hypothetical protein